MFMSMFCLAVGIATVILVIGTQGGTYNPLHFKKKETKA